MEQVNIPGLSIAINKEDSFKYIKECGYADLKNRTKITPDLSFQNAP
jgi:hypothetical protein